MGRTVRLPNDTYIDSSSIKDNVWVNVSDNVIINDTNYTLEEKRVWVNKAIKLCYVHINATAKTTSGDVVSGMPKALASLSLSGFNLTQLKPVWTWVRAAGTIACPTTHNVGDSIKISGCYPYSQL